VLMIGEGNKGKTSLIRLLTELVGSDSVCSGRIDEGMEGESHAGFVSELRERPQ
jgi:phage/plasmid-associated DNA primase